MTLPEHDPGRDTPKPGSPRGLPARQRALLLTGFGIAGFGAGWIIADRVGADGAGDRGIAAHPGRAAILESGDHAEDTTTRAWIAGLLSGIHQDSPASLAARVRRLEKTIESDGASDLATRDQLELVIALRQWGRLDPSAAVAHLTTRGDRTPVADPGIVDDILRGWARTDFAAALAAASRIHRPHWPKATEAVAEGLAEADPDRAWTLLRDASAAAEIAAPRDELIRGLARALADEDPKRVAEALFGPEGPGNGRNDPMLFTVGHHIAQSWCRRESPVAVLDWALAAGLDERSFPMFAEAALGSWLRSDADAAVSWLRAARDRDPDRFATLVAASLDPLLETDLAAALELHTAAGSATSTQARINAERILKHLAATDPSTAIDWIRAAETPQAIDDGFRTLLETLQREDPAAFAERRWDIAAEYLETRLPRDEPARGGFGSIGDLLIDRWNPRPGDLAALAELDDEAGALLLPSLDWLGPDADIAGLATALDAFPDSERKDEVRQNLVSQWASRDATAAAGWVAEIPAGRSRDLAVENVAAAWSRLDPAAAADWFSTQTVGTLNGAGALAVARSLASVDPAAAVRLALDVRERAGRPADLGAVLRTAAAADPDATLAAIGRLDVDGATGTSLLAEVAHLVPDGDRAPAGE